MSDRIRAFLAAQATDEPCLVMDLDVVRNNYQDFTQALPDSRIYYAVKANPAPRILQLLAELGSAFDCASMAEIRLALQAGATPARISYGSTIKKSADIARAYGLGVRLFAFDCSAEVDKIAAAAPGAAVFCRLAADGAGSDWPLTRKFGCLAGEAVDLLERAQALGLEPAGVSFHVGSQQADPEAWDGVLETSAWIFKTLEERGISLRLVNLGGGFPARLDRPVPELEAYGRAIRTALERHFGNRLPETILEPGRGLVGDAGIIQASVVLISQRAQVPVRWVFLDIGKFSGLAETMEEAIRYPIRTARDGDQKSPAVLAGPTCDSADVLYEHTPYLLPETLEIGDRVLIEGTGAYTTSFATVGFNGFPPLSMVCI